jgi:hydroxymethylbilane synthase
MPAQKITDDPMTDSRNGSHATKLRIGSRGSQLALWQANHISALLRARGHEVEIEIIHTTGDKITDVALAMVGTKGMFTKEIEEALAAGRVDLAVHSLKDLPTELPPGFEIAAITERQDPRDAFCSRHYARFQELPHGARVGTSSLRRQAQLKAVRPDLDIHPLRGNVDTRLRKLEQGEYDAIILAFAGLKRLGKTELVKQIIPADIMCPAAGQGALGIEIRLGDAATREHLKFLNDPAARAATTCERALLNSLGGGCQVPIGAFAEVHFVQDHAGLSRDNREGHDLSRADTMPRKEAALAAGVRIHLESIVADPDGSKLLRDSRDGDDPEKLGNAAGAALLARGGDQILEAVYGRGLAVPPQP